MINQWPLVYRDGDVCGYREHMIGGKSIPSLGILEPIRQHGSAR